MVSHNQIDDFNYIADSIQSNYRERILNIDIGHRHIYLQRSKCH